MKCSRMAVGMVSALMLGVWGCSDDSVIINAYGKHELGLSKADSCDTYRDYLLSSMALEIARYRYEGGGWKGGVDMDMASPPRDPSSDEAASNGGSGEFTQTNIQETGVDELDILKTDGEYLYVLRNDGSGVAVVRAWPAASLGVVAQISGKADAMRGYRYGIGLFLAGSKLIVIGQSYDEKPKVSVEVYDVSSPAAPKLIQETLAEGYYVSARFANDRIYLVLSHQLPYHSYAYAADNIPGLKPLSWWDAWSMSEKEKQARIAAAVPRIRSYLEGVIGDVSEALPKLTSQGAAQNLIGCEDIYLPKTSSRETGLLSLVELSGDTFGQVQASAIADNGWLVYATKENFYVISSSYTWHWYCGVGSDCKNYSHIHRFDLKASDGRVRYANSGEVEGLVTNPFWLSEHEGHLRVVSQDNFWLNQEGSRMSVLKLDGGAQMPVVGEVSGIAPGEQVYAARMFGDRGYVVTFERVDPLFTLDLSVPESPTIMGELKINGYSSYIHPLGEDALLTIGEDGDDDGRMLGVHLQIFDVSDMRNPTRIHQVLIERSPDAYSFSEAMYDHHAFTYHAPSGLLAIPMNIYRWGGGSGENFSGVLVYHATKASGFKLLGQINHDDLRVQNSWYWWTNLRRSSFMFKTAGVYDREAYIYTVSDSGVKVNDANAPSTEIGKVAFGSQK
ncbi:MAG: beta-propeller domain-containing protein [Proteobacteria bacterium]|nr:beta-propeller domain-containing protein [Pseudomonadota bacterium]